MASVPNYALYGDQAAPAWLDMVHFERIHERSSLHDFDIAPHTHDGLIQVLYVTRGGGEVMIDGARWPMRAPTLIVLPTPHVHAFRFTRDIDGPVVTAAQRPLESIVKVGAPDLLAQVRTPRVMGVAQAVRHKDALMPLFDAIAHEARGQTRDGVTAGPALLMALFVQIARIAQALGMDVPVVDAAAARTRKAQQVERFRALVDARFRDRLPIEAYSAELGVTAGQLSRVCREVLGVSALDVLNARIVHEAERELVYSILSVKQIAAVLGFADEAYFGRFFKKHTDRTPTEFRDAARRALAGTGQTSSAAGSSTPLRSSSRRFMPSSIFSR
ncbi:MAG: helix-turn-helix domain-containing protein [Burkholderiaceae bacterium]|jgi:AraC family transcriptional activator of pobA|nr:helix-turn-helix domain-containing protein [Burkholderiaceae bacterium]